ncbi:methylenetetrahydrofolate reductase [NAD(P)H] [Teredinibacter waterburyi]|uniref:methylenetetrahydrofolate reductase [NAD(P)H] n=1 Tax=Teredinibacter waterburyi TaxID=1500538 RepID=UPI00165FBF5E|nr:methylenetetrahydrofolate reductase [NAD(P)H] [Teredinibacter waterburyi]
MSEEQDFRLSFEFFPPKTDVGREKLKDVRAELVKLNPDFFSVTYGAGGSTRDNTKGIIKAMCSEGIDVAPHLSFGGDDEATIEAMLAEYKSQGVKRLVALRGDMPSGIGSAMQMVYANELVAFIRRKFGDDFEIEVAAYPEIHPEAKSYLDDVRYLKGKFEAGANSAITQYFFNPDAYFYFLEECKKEGIENRIYPGIMPITNFRNLARFSDACGAEIPRWMRKRLESYQDNSESLTAFGIDLITELCETLLENGAPGLHFYTMNQIEPTRSIIENLGLND